MFIRSGFTVPCHMILFCAPAVVANSTTISVGNIRPKLYRKAFIDASQTPTATFYLAGKVPGRYTCTSHVSSLGFDGSSGDQHGEVPQLRCCRMKCQRGSANRNVE